MSTPLLQEYFNQLDFYRKEFKNNELLLLMQVGSFYEAYEIEDRGCAKIISNVLRMHLTKKNGKQDSSNSNPWMVGFPHYVLSKHLNRLNEEGYTVVVFDQTNDEKPKRFLKGIYNYIIRMDSMDDDILHSTSNHERILYGLYIDKYKSNIQKSISFRYLMSLVLINLNTGSIQYIEYDTDDLIRDCVQFLIQFPIDELLLECNWNDDTKIDWLLKLESILSCKIIPFNISENFNHNKMIHFFHRIYSIPSDQDIIYELQLHYHINIIKTLYYTLLYIEKHDPLLISKLQRPILLKENNKQQFFYNRDAFLELNIFNICERRKSFVQKKKQKTLLDILSTNMSIPGKRHLENILRHPIYDQIDIIQHRHSLLQFFNQNSFNLQYNLPDIEWLYLKWKRNKLTIKQVGQFLSCLSFFFHQSDHYLWNYDFTELFNTFDEYWDIDLMIQSDYNFLKKVDGLKDYENQLSELDIKINSFDSKFKNTFKFNRNGLDSHFYCSIKKWISYQYEHPNDNIFYEISKNKSIVKLSFDELDKLIKQYNDLEKIRFSIIDQVFLDQSNFIFDKFDTIILNFIDKCSEFDCFYHLSYFFHKNSYCFPIHNQSSTSHHFIIENLRHPIYELIESDDLFVPYSFSIDTINNPIGLLIYGMNSSGKSTFLKSFGIAIWLSQCGLMVPASSFHHTLTNGILTKIGTFDNLYLKHSTFVAEMSELHCIFQKANSHSIILCDELTSGTETRSATGIVASCLSHFLQNSIPFLFTTHLHSLNFIPELSNNQKLRICHFEIKSEDNYSNSSNKPLLIENIQLRYDRTLKDGPGKDIYGIEIAKSLGLPSEFITNAFQYRERIQVIINNPNLEKTSKYNSKLLVNECSICKSTLNLHTHHITPQKEWNNNHIPSNHKKDGLYNLIILCETCHLKIHN